MNVFKKKLHLEPVSEEQKIYNVFQKSQNEDPCPGDLSSFHFSW